MNNDEIRNSNDESSSNVEIPMTKRTPFSGAPEGPCFPNDQKRGPSGAPLKDSFLSLIRYFHFVIRI